ncbi:hypothetical protein F2Q69_00017382 [Brassica cretica]|uniref:K-box domain-containing protein n=1 Tax=Brassica cretica TaxID=69181 RepID=A0A8S9QMJ3_BRACR|nr:hypothetical protein F2Q69_00017382 [Brassica cretica]
MPRTTRRSVKQRLQYIQVIQELQEEIKLLQISNEKLNGEGLDGLSYTELASLETMLKEGFRIVEEQTDKAQQEQLLREIVDCDVMGKEWLDEKEKEDLAYQSLLARRRTAMRNKARELRLSPQDSQKEHSYNHETLMLTIECLKVEKERLRVLNQRMIGKELDGMGYSELLVFSCAIQGGMLKAEEEKKKIKRARQTLQKLKASSTYARVCQLDSRIVSAAALSEVGCHLPCVELFHPEAKTRALDEEFDKCMWKIVYHMSYDIVG